jgi:hypothetical protein
MANFLVLIIFFSRDYFDVVIVAALADRLSRRSPVNGETAN